ncbi:SDR family oxidoreductase [Natronomonas sp.]|uniref:SDR family oxidoreductase n=1 Tax=Natronomonas sp. TaxID=2184060 RepID=UPI002639615D|nr:SDR family oxidoreductase [Natronomonas sp.]
MTRSIDGDAAIVTGASSGIGRETALALAREGADVALAARREERLSELAERIEAETDAEALVVPTDMREESAVEALVETAVEAFGGLDVLVNNAGIVVGQGIEDLPTSEYRAMMETNADGMFFATRAALSHLRESAGTIVFIGSFAGQYPRSYNPVYAATKWWVRGFAQSVAAETTGDVAVTTINPSEVRTEIAAQTGESFEERFDEGEALEPEDIAEGVVFAAKQDDAMVSELDLYRRDKFEIF